MSKVGKALITIPQGVTVTVTGNQVSVQGKFGVLSHTIPSGISVNLDGQTLTVHRDGDSKTVRALHGTTRALIMNQVLGVSVGFSKVLELVGTGYRVRAQGNKIILSLGFSHEVEYVPPEGITLQVEGTNLITIKGSDKQIVGQVAAIIRSYKKPEPYKGKGIRYQGEAVRRKAGKAAKGATA